MTFSIFEVPHFESNDKPYVVLFKCLLKIQKRIHKPGRKFGNKEEREKKRKFPIITPLLAPQE